MDTNATAIAGKVDSDDFYATEMPMSDQDSTTVSSAISSNSTAIANLPITYLGSVSSLPTLNPTQNGNIGFTFANDIMLGNVTIPAGTRFLGIIQSNIAHVEGISPSGDMYLLRYVPTGNTWSFLSQLATKSRTPQYTSVDVSGTPIVTSDSGWYYNQINYASILPTNARIIGVASSGSWDANVFYTIQWPTSIKFTSPTSKTLASNHNIVIFYYVDD